MANKPETIVISNFAGRLTRIQNGDLNSGFAKFSSSWGYDPFSDPMTLTWLEQPASIATTAVTDVILDFKPWFDAANNQQYIFGIGAGGKLYQIQPNSLSNPNVDSVVGVTSIAASSPTFTFGGSLETFGSVEKLYVGHDKGVNVTSLPPTGAADTVVGNFSNYVANRARPLQVFAGYLAFGNGNTIGVIDATGTVTSSVIGTGQGNTYSELNPPLPTSNYVTDLDTSPDRNYLMITSTEAPNEEIMSPPDDQQAAAASNGNISQWNGIDDGITTAYAIPSFGVSALQVYLQSNYFFSSDTFGMAVSDGQKKLLTLQNNKPPLPNATLVNGNFISWVSTEILGTSSIGASLYYFGSLDNETPTGLYRLMRYTTNLPRGFVYQVPAQILTNNKYAGLNQSLSSVATTSYGKHYFSTFEINNVDNTPTSSVTGRLNRFLVTSTGTGIPQQGVYETQTQLFSKKIHVEQVRVYTNPTTTGNAFQLDLIGADGNVIENGTFTYTYAAGDDITKLQGPMERINFNPAAEIGFALGLRFTNTGTTNMKIKKVEVDWGYEGK